MRKEKVLSLWGVSDFNYAGEWKCDRGMTWRDRLSQNKTGASAAPAGNYGAIFFWSLLRLTQALISRVDARMAPTTPREIPTGIW